MKILTLLILACGLVAAQYQPPIGSGGGPPTGSAGGALAGTYPNPTIAGLGTNAGYAVCTDGSANLIFCSGSSAPALLGATTNTFTGIQKTSSYFFSSQTGLGTTTAIGSYLQNTTLSTSGAKVQVSPALEFEGHVDNTTSGDVDNFARARLYYLPVTAASPTGVWHFQGSIDTGTPSFSDAMTLTSGGTLTLFSNVTTPAVYFGSGSSTIIDDASSNGALRIRTNNSAAGVILNVSTDSVLAVKNRGNSAAAQVTANSYVSAGTKFTISGCSAGTTVGGATAGTFVSGTSGPCTVVITLNGATGITAPNGWTCAAEDLTTPANLISQSASSATTCTVTGTTVTGDTISFLAMAF